MGKSVDIDKTRTEIREMFAKWGIDRSEYEITYQEESLTSGVKHRLPGAIIRYLRDGKWQSVACYSKWDRGTNLRQLFLFLDRIRISEKVGIQYQGLSHSTDVAASPKAAENSERDRKETILDAYDFLGASPGDPTELIKDIFKKKAIYYHPDKPGGTEDKMKALNESYELIMRSRGEQP